MSRKYVVVLKICKSCSGSRSKCVDRDLNKDTNNSTRRGSNVGKVEVKIVGGVRRWCW